MAINWDMAVARLSRRGQDGKLLSAITGEETDEELRALMARLARECPLSQHHARCPFCALSHLYHFSLQHLLKSLSRKTLMGLFELEWEVRNTAVAAAVPHAGVNFTSQADAAA